MIDLSVRGLVKGFEQGNDILKGITFDVNAGERVGILGRNGCGKTTFFRILSGELQPDAGTVSIASGRRLGLISQIPSTPTAGRRRTCCVRRTGGSMTWRRA